MATNRRFDTTDTLSLQCSAGAAVDSGDPVAFGAALTGVALTDADENELTTVQVRPGSVFTCEVVAASALGSPITGSAVTPGDQLYRSSGGIISKTSSGVKFGIALGVYNDQKGGYLDDVAIASGETDTIDVFLNC